ncbi:MAG: hypothetical protein JWN98_1485 [Abditibacteriota bacterium]|nr:hypothetical protein [Abditibacteriota bacterium]
MRFLFPCLFFALWMLVLSGLPTHAQSTLAALPDLSIELGPENRGRGLSAANDGDGRNEPDTIAGVPVRRLIGPQPNVGYLYLKIEDVTWKNMAPRDVYITVDAFDDRFARVVVQYDKAATKPNVGTQYTAAEGSLLLTGSRKAWRSGYFLLKQASLKGGQNFGADLRLNAPSGTAIRRVTISTQRPPNFDSSGALDESTLQALRVDRGPQRGRMEWTIGNDAGRADAQFYRAIGVSSVESYVHWASVEEKKNQWDWSRWDKQVADLQAAKLKWVPFLLVGMAYGTPLWFQESAASHNYKCLDHGQESRVQSLWNPALRPAVDRFLKAFAERYKKTGVVESLLLGVTGIYGESIYPAGPEGGWTAELTGTYHNHAGWWAGDTFAQEAFRAAMKRQYTSLEKLNRTWGTQYVSWSQVAPFVPDKAPNDRARADFVGWYQQAMTEWSVFWVATTRKYFPSTPIYLCTGGDGDPMLGADFSAQTKAIAPFGAGVRITNEGSDYAANWSLTREVATATRLYKTYAGFEPASEVSPSGIVARVYNATASGARQLHDYAPNMMNDPAALQNARAHASYLRQRQPLVEAAIYVPRETWEVEPQRIGQFYDLARRLRDAIDLDFVTRHTVLDGVLRNTKVLFLASAPVLEPVVASAIERWVKAGGTLVTFGTQAELGARLHDNAAWRARLLAAVAGNAAAVAPALEGPAPARWVQNIGEPSDEVWLSGDWFHRESGGEWANIPNATKRWGGARAGLLVPAGNRNGTLRMDIYVPEGAVQHEPVKVLWNGVALGEITKSGRQIVEWKLPAASAANSLGHLEIVTRTWQPSALASGDTRHLGVALRQVEVFAEGAAQAAPSRAVVQWKVDAGTLGTFARRVGRGRTIHLPYSDAQSATRVVAVLLAESARYLPEAKLTVPDGRLDNRFATRTKTETLWLDAANATIQAK